MLKGVSFVVEPGEAVALVGPSGSGKSSIVKLLLRLYVPAAGSVLIDDRDVGDYQTNWLRRHVAIVGQEPVLYGRSIYHNIVFGLETIDGAAECDVPTREEVCPAHCFITRLIHIVSLFSACFDPVHIVLSLNISNLLSDLTVSSSDKKHWARILTSMIRRLINLIAC